MNQSDSIPRSCGLAVFFTLMWFASFAQLHTFRYQRSIKPQGDGWHAIQPGASTLSQSLSNRNDLRIYNIGDDTTEIPYLLQDLGNKTEVKDVAFDLVNQTRDANSSYVTLKFNGKKLVNEIRLDVGQANFDKWIKVQGSQDNREWFTIRERVRIVGFDNGEADYRYTTLKFRPMEFAYFRVVIDDSNSPGIEITGAHAYEVTTDTGRYEALKISDRSITENRKEKTTIAMIELAGSNFIDHITIAPDTKDDFYRNINLYYLSGVTKTQTGQVEHWTLASTGIFTSIGDQAQAGNTTTLPCYGFKTNRLKLEIINLDNQPVKLGDIKVYSESVRLISKLPGNGDLVLAYGKENCPAPQYDLVHFSKNIPSELKQALLLDETAISREAAAKKDPLIEDKVWLWVAMGAILLIIIVFSLSMLRKSA